MTMLQIVIVTAFGIVGFVAFAGLMIHATKADLVDDCAVCHHPLPEGIHGLCDRCARSYFRHTTADCGADTSAPYHHSARSVPAHTDWADRAAAEVIQDRRVA